MIYDIPLSADDSIQLERSQLDNWSTRHMGDNEHRENAKLNLKHIGEQQKFVEDIHVQLPSFCPPLCMHADTMMDRNAQWRAGKEIQQDVRDHKKKHICMLKEQNLYLSSRTVPTTIHASLTA